MKTSVILFLALLLCTGMCAQYSLSGEVQDPDGLPVAYANAALYAAADSQLIKVETTDTEGRFTFARVGTVPAYLMVTFIGYPDLLRADINLTADTDLGVMIMQSASLELQGVTVTGRRALVEVKTDRTVFNVQGTINAAGNDALGLLRMAPGVTLDNSDNVSILSRSGVIFYVDGRRLPLSGTDLSNYLRNLTSEQIETIQIISSPGAKYEAEGNAGIIDIRLKKAENEGTNGTLSASGSQGRYAIYALNASGNYRNRKFNVYGNLGYSSNESYTDNYFVSRQRDFLLLDDQYSRPLLTTPSVRVGTDIYLGKRQTLGILYGGQFQNSERNVDNRTSVITDSSGSIKGGPCSENMADSTLVGGVLGRGDHTQNTFNINYNLAIASGHNLSVDLDLGRYRNNDVLAQPNQYFSPTAAPLSNADAYFDTPIYIDIYTGRLDYDFPLGKGAASAGAKITRVSTENTFLAYDGLSPTGNLREDRSNAFNYDETVYAGYFSYAGSFSDRLQYSLGLRAEATTALGELRTIPQGTTTTPVDSNYFSLFPNAGLTYQLAEDQVLSLRYGRRINRPDYNVLNPFRVQLNELSYEAGNPNLGPEIVNNIQLGYNLKSRYNFQLSYSRTESAIARLFSPDEEVLQAGFATYDNLNKRTVYSFSASAPVEITDWWNIYTSAAAAYASNQARFDDFDAVVDVTQFNYSLLLQQTFSLPYDITGELTGRYVSAGISEGVFVYDAYGFVNVGLQRTFLDGNLNVKISGNDLFRNVVINGGSDFNGLSVRGNIMRDSRRVALSMSYVLGNQKVSSRRRDTGLDDAAGRVK